MGDTLKKTTEYGWYCATCESWVVNHHVTFEETHDPRGGGCGETVEEKEADNNE